MGFACFSLTIIFEDKIIGDKSMLVKQFSNIAKWKVKLQGILFFVFAFLYLFFGPFVILPVK